MAVSWTDPTGGRGVYPAEASFYTPAAISPYMAALIARQREQNQKQISDALQQAVSGVGKYMQQRQSDQIASSLLAGSAQKPDVVSWPSLETQGATGGQLTPAEIAQNKSLGFPSTQIATPTQAYAGHEQWQKDVEDSTKQWYDQAAKEAQIEHLGRLGFANNPSGAERYPVQLPDGSTVYVTGNKAAQMAQPTTPSAGRAPAKDPWANLIPVARGKLDEQGNFTNAYPEAAQGDVLQMRTPVGKTVTVPWAEYNKRSIAPRGMAQSDINQAAAALNNQAPLPAPDVPAADYSNTIPTAAAKPLDADTARAILAEVGGDKDKARALAKQRGYVF